MPDKAEMHSQTPMYTSAGQANEYAIRNRRPGWIFGWAVEAHLLTPDDINQRMRREKEHQRAGHCVLATSQTYTAVRVTAATYLKASLCCTARISNDSENNIFVVCNYGPWPLSNTRLNKHNKIRIIFYEDPYDPDKVPPPHSSPQGSILLLAILSWSIPARPPARAS